MITAITNYFSEFKILKKVSRDFWLANAIQFFDGMAYFSMITMMSLYLTKNCGFNDVDSGAWVGIFTLYITAFTFAVGSICDVIGIKKSFVIGFTLLAISRLILGVAPDLEMLEGFALRGFFEGIFGFLHIENIPEFFQVNDLVWTVKGAIIIMSLGTAFMGPVVMTSLRRFTNKETRATGFNMYYLLMNIGAIIASAIVFDGFRKGLPWLANGFDSIGMPDGVVTFVRNGFGETTGNLAIFIFGFVMSVITLLLSLMLNEDNYAEESERVAPGENAKRPLAIFLEVWKEKPFQKLLLFLLLTIGVRLVFTNQFLVMPKYYSRMLYDDFSLGLANSINPFIIVVGLIILIPIINRFATIKLIIFGMIVSAFSLVMLAVPVEWIMALPWIDTLSGAYMFMIVSQIIIFAFGELIFNPRFMEYIASMAPQDRVSSYMALAGLPNFIAKPINGFVSGILISRYCYDGMRPKIETGFITYLQSPEFMWMIYLLLAIMSPIAVVWMRNFITDEPPNRSGEQLEDNQTTEDMTTNSENDNMEGEKA